MRRSKRFKTGHFSCYKKLVGTTEVKTMHSLSRNSEKEERVVVAVRIRPDSSAPPSLHIAKVISGQVVIEVPPEKEKKVVANFGVISKRSTSSSMSGKPKSVKCFKYDQVYSPSTSQRKVYDDLGRGVIQNCFKGYNSCIFAYGQTGSGKTHTMFGPPQGEFIDRGIIPRLCEDLFKTLAEFRRRSEEENKNIEYSVLCSMIEIYNENIRDLLTDPKCKADDLKIREDPSRGWYVESLGLFSVQNGEEVQDMIQVGNANRTTAKTKMNDYSSRSHTIFQLKVVQTQEHRNSDARVLYTTDTQSLVNLIDLAGSEQIGSSLKKGASEVENAGLREKELISINVSLSALGLVITKLAKMYMGDKSITHIPYRNSKLTKLLSDSLGGNSKSVMIATMSPLSSNYEQSISTCRYADRVKSIKNFPVVNVDRKDKIIKQLREKIELLKKRQLNEEDYNLLKELKRLNGSMSEDLEQLKRKNEYEKQVHMNLSSHLQAENLHLKTRVDQQEKTISELELENKILKRNLNHSEEKKNELEIKLFNMKKKYELLQKQVVKNMKIKENVQVKQDFITSEFISINKSLEALKSSVNNFWTKE